MKKMILLTLALTLLSFTAIEAHPPTPYCDCEFCAENQDKVCENCLTTDIYPCSEYSALYCTAR